MVRIALAFDGREHSGAALRWVVDRATTLTDPVSVTLHVTGLPWFHHRSDVDLAAAASELADAVGDVDVSTEVRRAAPLTAADDADLVVLGVPAGGARGSGAGLVRRLIRRAPVPVCLVPGGWIRVDGAVTLAGGDALPDAARAFARREAERSGLPLGTARLQDRRILPVPDGPDAPQLKLLVVPTEFLGGFEPAFGDALVRDALRALRCPVCIVPSAPASAGTAAAEGAR